LTARDGALTQPAHAWTRSRKAGHPATRLRAMRRTPVQAFDLPRPMRFSLVPFQGPAYPMNVSGEFTVNAPRDVVFKTLRDASSFVRFVDGVQDLKEIDPTHYEAVFETRVAYLKFRFNVTVEVTRAEEPSEIEA